MNSIVARPHIVILSLAYAPFIGGAEVALQNITCRLREHFSFTCITHYFDRCLPREERIDGIVVRRVGIGGFYDNMYRQYIQKFFYSFFAYVALEQEHRRNPIRALWLMMASYGVPAALLFKFFHPRVLLLLTLQEGDAESHILRRVGIFYWLWKRIFRVADRIQVISVYLKNFALRHGAMCPIDIVPNGVSIAQNAERRFPLLGISRSETNSENIIITTSRLVEKNAIDILIRAAAELRTMRNIPSFRVHIVGDGPLRPELETLTTQLGLRDTVSFFGAVAPEEIPKYLARASLFVRPSRSEGLGSSFLEAMAAGLPVIGTAVGGIPDFLHDRDTGLITRVDDPRDLALKIYELLKDDKLYERLSIAGPDLVRRQYDWKHIAEKMKFIFDQLCVS